MESSSKEPSTDDLRRDVKELRQRVDVLEQLLRGSNIPQGPQIPSLEPAEIPEKIETPPVLSSASGVSGSPPRGEPSSLESRIGAQIFNRVGIFAVLAGAAWFLKLAIDRAWVGPGLRVAIGLVAAIALAIWSERFRRDRSVAFSYTLKALGAGIAYLSLWASFNLYHLLPASIVLAAMVAVTVANAALALLQDSELLAVLALAGGLATPALLSTGESREIFLFSYLLLLDIGALALTAIRPWPRLTIGAFAGTTAYFASWWWSQNQATANQVATGVFIALFFGLFTAAPMLAFRRAATRLAGMSGNDRLLSALPIAVGITAFLEAASLVRANSVTAGISWIAATLGLISLLIVGLMLAGVAQLERVADRLRDMHLSMATAFLALAGWLQFHGYGIPLSWCAELLALIAAAAHFREHVIAGALRWNVFAMLLLSFGALLLLGAYDRPSAANAAFLNAEFATYIAGLAIFATLALLGWKVFASTRPALNTPALPAGNSWTGLAAISTVVFNVIALLAVSLQIDLLWRRANMPIGVNAPWHGLVYLEFTYSAWFMLYGAGLMVAGFWRRSAFLRWQALILLTLSILKVFLVDASHLSEGYRVASFIGLGVLLLAVSLAYQRDWLGLRRTDSA